MLIDISDVQFFKWDARKSRILRELREVSNTSRRALGNKILQQGGNCTHEHIRNLERDKVQQYISVDTLISLCEGLEVPLSRFVSVTPKK